MKEPDPTIRLPLAEKPRVSLLIPTISQAEKLEACLRSLAAYLPESVPCEVIVVLNAATDCVRRLVREKCRGLKVSESAVNLGVAGGYNRARSLAGGEFLVLLHDDVVIGPGWLEPLLATADAHPSAGAVGCRVLNPDGSLQHAGCILWRNGLTSPLPVSANPPDRPWPADYVGTCCILVRTLLWDAMGGLDERIYPAYYVDVSLAMNLRRLGSTVLCEPASSLRHHSRSSSTNPYATFLSMRNQARFMAQWSDEMEEFEPWAPDSPDAIPNAIRRTRLTAERLAASWQPISPVEPPPYDPINQEIRHLQFAVETSDAWVEHRIRQVQEDSTTAAQATAAELAQLRERLATREHEIKTLHDRVDSLTSERNHAQRASRWQRILNRVKRKLSWNGRKGHV